MCDETTLTQKTSNRAENMPNQAKNTIRDRTKNSPKIHTQSQHSEFWTTVKKGLVRLKICLSPGPSKIRSFMVGSTKTSLTNDLKHQNKSRERGQKIGRRPFRNNQGPVTGTSRGQSNGIHHKTHWRENPVTLSIPILHQNINTAATRRSKFGVEAKRSMVWRPHLALAVDQIGALAFSGHDK